MKKTRILSAILSAILAFTTVPMAALPVFAATPELGDELLTGGEWEGATNVKVPDYISVTGIPYSKSLQYFLKLDEGTKLETGDYTVSFQVRSTSEEVAYSDFVRVSGLGKWAGAATYRISDGEGGKINENETYTMTVALRGKTGNEVVQLKLRNGDNDSNNNFANSMCVPKETAAQTYPNELHLTTEWQTFTFENLRFNDSFQGAGTDYNVWIEFYNSSNYDTFDIANISLVGSESGEVCVNRNSTVDDGNGWDNKTFVSHLEDVTRTDKLYFSMRDFGPEFSTVTRGSTRDIILTKSWQTFTANFEVVEDNSYAAGQTLTPSWQGAGSNYNVWIPFQNLSRVGTDEATVSFDIKVFALVHNESGKNYIAGNEYKLTGLYDETASGWQAPNSGGEREVVNKTVTGFTNAYTYTYDDSKAITAGEYKLTAELTATEATQVEAVITYSDNTEVTAESQTVTTNTDTVIYTIEAEAGDVESVALRQVDGDAVIRFGEISLIQTSETEDPDNGGDEGEDPVNPNPNPGDDEEEDEDDVTTSDNSVELVLEVKDAEDLDDDDIVDIDRTFEVDIKAYATGEETQSIAGSGFTVDYDSKLVTFEGLTSDYANSANVEDYPEAFQFIVSVNQPAIEVDSAGVTLATAKFTVNDDVDNVVDEDAAVITLNDDIVDVVVKLANEKLEFVPDVTKAKAELHNIVITVDIDENITVPAGLPTTLYANYMDGKLYDEDGDEYTMPELDEFTSTNDGYRVGDGWKLDNADFDLGDDTFTKSATLSLEAVELATVTFAAGENGTVTLEPVTVDADTKLWDIVKDIDTEDNEDIVPNDFYEFEGWYYNDNKIDENSQFTAAVVSEQFPITVKFKPGNVDTTIEYINYVTGDEIEPKADEKAEVSAIVGDELSVTPKYIEGYVLESVTAKDANNANIELTKDGDAYVSTNVLAGDVTITVNYRPVVTVIVYTDADDETAERDFNKYYAKHGIVGLYDKIKCEEALVGINVDITYFNADGTVADADYRYIDDADNNKLFTDGENEYADAAAILAASYDGNTVITPIAVKQWKISYEAGEGVTAIDPEYEFVTDGAAITEPDVTTDIPGYVVAWTPALDGAIADEAKTFTATASAKPYAFTYTNGDGFLTFVPVSGFTVDGEGYTANCSEDAVFTLTADAGYEVDAVKYVYGETEVPMTAEEGTGKYTIPKAVILQAIEIVATAKKTEFALELDEELNADTEVVRIGENIVITPAEGAVIVNVTVTVEGGETYTLTAVDGKYTLDGEKTIGKVTITANGLAEGVAIGFITAGEYKALANNTQIVKVTGVASTATVTMGDKDLYWSARYGAHIMIVADTETAATLANGMEIDETKEATAINYNGDVNGNGKINTADAAIVSELLLNPNTNAYEDIVRLSADVYPDPYDDAYVTVDDCMWILRQEYPAQPNN